VLLAGTVGEVSLRFRIWTGEGRSAEENPEAV